MEMNPLYFKHLGPIEAANRKPGPSEIAHEKGAISPQAAQRKYLDRAKVTAERSTCPCDTHMCLMAELDSRQANAAELAGANRLRAQGTGAKA